MAPDKTTITITLANFLSREGSTRDTLLVVPFNNLALDHKHNAENVFLWAHRNLPSGTMDELAKILKVDRYEFSDICFRLERYRDNWEPYKPIVQYTASGLSVIERRVLT